MDAQELIRNEERILSLIQANIRALSQSRQLDKHRMGHDFAELRDAASKAHEEDLPALFDQMNVSRAIMEFDFKGDLPEYGNPYFAHLVVEEAGKVKHLLLGHRSFLHIPEYPIIDWRHAPVAKIFFSYREGEEYEEELPNGNIRSGRILHRVIVTISGAKLRQIIAGDQVFELSEEGIWEPGTRQLRPVLAGGAGSAARSQKLGTGGTLATQHDIAALLDPDQYALLSKDTDEPLLILGGAGCGKTTVALYRLSSLHFRDPARFRERSMAVIVPENGLAALTTRLLASMGLPNVEVATFDQWIERQARRLIRRLPKRVYPFTPASVVKLKRDDRIILAIEKLIAEQRAALIAEIEQSYPELGPLLGELAEASGPLLKDFKGFEKRVASLNLGGTKGEAITKFLKRKRDRLYRFSDDLLDLGTHEDILSQVFGAGHKGDVLNLVRHTKAQNSEPEDYSGVDKERLTGLDGMAIDEDEDVAGTIDSEDFTLLLEIAYQKTGTNHSAAGDLKTYAHLIIDEAQELATTELHALGRSLKADGTVTIAGDAAQHTDETSTFRSWDHVLEVLGVPYIAPDHLATNYRCSRQVAEFAHKVLGPIAPARMPPARREGAPVMVSEFGEEGHTTLVMIEAITDLLIAEPRASVAVICKTRRSAERVYENLNDLSQVRLVLDGAFSFRPGVDVTDLPQVKGLEFDYVILPDAAMYRNNPEDRRALHVAATRAVHQLWVLSAGKLSDMIPREV